MEGGRGYLVVALMLWSAGILSGQVSLLQALAGLTAATVLWALYFAVGFWAFMRGHQANVLGLALTLGLPLLAYLLYQLHVPSLAALLPPGSVYQATADWPSWLWGPFLGGIGAAGDRSLVAGALAIGNCAAGMMRIRAEWRVGHDDGGRILQPSSLGLLDSHIVVKHRVNFCSENVPFFVCPRGVVVIR